MYVQRGSMDAHPGVCRFDAPSGGWVREEEEANQMLPRVQSARHDDEPYISK